MINSCENPVALAAPSLVDQEYTITQNSVVYQIPVFTVDPAWCDIIYSFTVTEPNGQLAITFDANMDQRIFTFDNVDSVALAGEIFKDYTVTVTADAGIVTSKQAQTQFNL